MIGLMDNSDKTATVSIPHIVSKNESIVKENINRMKMKWKINETLDMKNTILKFTIPLDEINSRLDNTEDQEDLKA